MPVRERKWREGREVKQAGNSTNWSLLRSRLCRDERRVKEAGRQVRWFLESLEMRISDLIFVTSLTSQASGEKIAMWRNLKYLHMKKMEIYKISPHVACV